MAKIPVITGSLTEVRSIIPGAFSSTALNIFISLALLIILKILIIFHLLKNLDTYKHAILEIIVLFCLQQLYLYVNKLFLHIQLMGNPFLMEIHQIHNRLKFCVNLDDFKILIQKNLKLLFRFN